ncbi:hypothetical protein SAMN05444161_6571 [Rhizobiales bacterium GAS191]|nr:hypothetical protein SAMN05444161_6571 [Rhizobiales bacterium GAS191]
MVSGPYAAALIGWREAVAAIYHEVRAAHGADPRAAWMHFRERRDHLYKHHACSALTDLEKQRFDGFDYHAYDPQLCFVGEVDYGVEEVSLETEISEGALPYRRIGVARFLRRGTPHSLDLYWLDIYGGGLWLPVGDETNGTTSYGGGRYLFDTAKGANLGLHVDGKRILLDLNFLYPPSCALNAAWICPLCPPANRLPFAVNAGERSFAEEAGNIAVGRRAFR